MQVLPIFLIIVVIALTVLFFVYKDKLLRPPFSTSVQQIATGTELYIINSQLYNDKKPAYLSVAPNGTQGPFFQWKDAPDTSCVWIWEENVSECFGLDTIPQYNCKKGYYNTSTYTYDCTKCVCTNPNPALCTTYLEGAAFCTACSDGLDKTPYTSLSIKNKAFLVYLTSLYPFGGVPQSFDVETTVNRVWIESRNPANSSSALFDTSVSFKNSPEKGPTVYYMSNSLVVSQYGATIMDATTQRADDSVYYLSFLNSN